MSDRPVIDGTTVFDPLIDNESVLDDEITPLMEKVYAICRKHGIPFLARFQFSGEGFADFVSLTPGAAAYFVDMIKVIRPDWLEEKKPTA